METDMIKEGILNIGTPESAGISSGHIANYLGRLRDMNYDLHSLQIVKDQKLIFANAAEPYTLRDGHRLLSAAKPILAAAVLFAIDEGALTFESRILPLFADKLPAEYDRRLEAVTVYDLLTMQTGQNSDEAFRQFIENQDIDLCACFFRTPMDCEPGTRFFYNNAVPHLLFTLVERATGVDIGTYIREKLGTPLGMDIVAQYNKDHVYDPVTTVVTAEGFLKLGLWFLQQGKWDGKQLLDSELMKRACTQQVWTGVEEAGYHNGKGYCMQLWKNAFGGCRMDGGGGQYALILPEQNMVAAIMGNDSRGEQAVRLFYDEILCKMIGRALPADPEERLRLEAAGKKMSRAPYWTVPHHGEWEDRAKGTFRFLSNPWRIETVNLCFRRKTVILLIEQHGDKNEYEIGLDGAWCESPIPLILEPDVSIQNRIYGPDPRVCMLTGGWEEKAVFVISCKSIASMGEYVFRFAFHEGKLEIRIPNGISGGMKPEEGTSCVQSAM